MVGTTRHDKVSTVGNVSYIGNVGNVGNIGIVGKVSTMLDVRRSAGRSVRWSVCNAFVKNALNREFHVLK